MTDLEQLAETAKQAQREYDKAKEAIKNEAKSRAEDIPQGTLVATSFKDGFEWKCNADGEAVVRHVAATISSAVQTFNNQTTKEAGLNKIMLAIAIMKEVENLTKAEIND